MLLYLEGCIYALGVGIFLRIATGENTMAVLGGLLALGMSFFLLKPWTPDLARAAAYIDTRIPSAAYSSSLLL